MSYNAYNNNVPAQQDMCMDWDSAIETDGQEFITLEEGDYNFEITNFERGRFPGSAKIPACNKAAITAVVRTAEGIATVKFDLILYRSLEWRISAFFRCIHNSITHAAAAGDAVYIFDAAIFVDGGHCLGDQYLGIGRRRALILFHGSSL